MRATFIAVLGAALCWGWVAAAPAEEAAMPPELSAIADELRLEPNPEVQIDPSGHYLVNGRPRPLLGVQPLNSNFAADLLPTEGYGPEWKWIYEEPLNHANAQRLGFDAVSVCVMPGWLESFASAYARHPHARNERRFERVVRDSGLLLQADCSTTPWTHGLLAEEGLLAGAVPAEAVNAFNKRARNHWVPYSVLHPEGRKLYMALWRSAAREMKAAKSPLLMLELFNEPAYDDPSDHNRARFAEYLKRRYKTPAALNKRWRSGYRDFAAAAAFESPTENPGLCVDWSKFMEEGFAELCREGGAEIKKILPAARLCLQPLAGNLYRSLPQTHVNAYLINRDLETVSLPTTGGIVYGEGMGFNAPPKRSLEAPGVSGAVAEGLLMRAYFLGLADGKPLHNPEAYTGDNHRETLNRIWLDFARASDAVFMFEWSKRGWDWKPKGSAEGGRRIAERLPWMILNPYAYPPADLRSFLDAKREIFRFGDFLFTRDRGVARETAILFSNPTERIAAATGNILKNEIAGYAAALAFAHVPVNGLFEEQLSEDRAGGFRAIVAAGVRNTYAETLPRLRRLVEAGSTLIVGADFLGEDEYGAAADNGLLAGLTFTDNPAAPVSEIAWTHSRGPKPPGRFPGRNLRRAVADRSWTVFAEQDGDPVVLGRKLKKGAVYVITPRMQTYALGAVLRALLARHGVLPSVDLVRADGQDPAVGVEAHSARRDGLELHYLFNWDNYPKRVAIALADGAAAADLSANRLLPVAGKRATVLLEPQHRMIVGVGSEAALVRRFGALPPVTAEALRGEETTLAARLEAERALRAGEAFAYEVDPQLTAPLDLRAFANRAFVDERADDGKGGWTDQGPEMSLTGVPFGTQRFLGVPCEIIRFDQNDNRTCVVLASRRDKAGASPVAVEGVAVGAKVRSLVFFHASAWTKNGARIMTYRIHYASGKTLDVPVVGGENIGDWFLGPANAKVNHLVAWRNRENRGFYGWRWENPDPDDEVVSFDAVSANGDSIPILIAATAERHDGRIRQAAANHFPEQVTTQTWGNLTAMQDADGAIRIGLTEKTTAWCGFRIFSEDHAPSALTPEMLETGVLKFEVDGGDDLFGNARGGQLLQVTLLAAKPSLKDHQNGQYIAIDAGMAAKGVDNTPGTFQEVVLPLARMKKDGRFPDGVNGVALQYRGVADAGVVVRRFRLEIPAASGE